MCSLLQFLNEVTFLVKERGKAAMPLYSVISYDQQYQHGGDTKFQGGRNISGT
jgi:hypothetical protein